MPNCGCADSQVMVIVDVRPTGGRGDVGIPTDAYFAVEEIKDVSL
jgi:26S proteasome regulatory subunit N8